MIESRREQLAEIRSKLDLLRQVEAEHKFGVSIEGPRELEPIPELPEGVTDVFSLFYRLGGNYFVFRQPDAIKSPDTWADRFPGPRCGLSRGCTNRHRERRRHPP